MALYEYSGQLTTGAAITGELEAASPDDARQSLAATNVHITQLAATTAMRSVRSLSHDDVMFFNEQLASLARSGMALDVGLRLLAKDLRRGRLKTVVQHLASEVERGVPLEKALAAQRGQFPPLYADVLLAGAKSQQLGETLLNFSAHLKLMDSGRRLFWESIVYPIVVLALGFCVMSFFMWFIVPGFGSIYAEFFRNPPPLYDANWTEVEVNTNLPFLTRMMLKLSVHWSTVAITTLSVVAAIAFLFITLGLSDHGRLLRERIVSWLPIIGTVRRRSLMARFAQASSLGARAGLDLPVLLRAASAATGSQLLTQDAIELAVRVERGGEPLQSALPCRVIPPIFGYTVAMAGARGQLASALADMATAYDQLARHRLHMIKMILSPLLILLTAIVIGLGAVAILQPLMQLLSFLTFGP